VHCACAGSVERTPSVDIRPEWDLLEVIDFTQLAKLYLEVDDAELLRECGKLRFYDKVCADENMRCGAGSSWVDAQRAAVGAPTARRSGV
jgi:hypothetical protein